MGRRKNEAGRTGARGSGCTGRKWPQREGVQGKRGGKYGSEKDWPNLAVLDFGLPENQVQKVVVAGLDLVARRSNYDGRQWLIESDFEVGKGQLRNGVQENRVDKYGSEKDWPNLAVLD